MTETAWSPRRLRAVRQEKSSLAESLASYSEAERKRLIQGLPDDKALAFLFEWEFWARPSQVPPDGDWATWLILAGRGFGKTRTGVEWVRKHVEGITPLTAPEKNAARRIAIVAETAADGRDVLVEGESGILANSMPGFAPRYEPSKRRLTWANGAIATLYNAREPDQLRGPQHDLAWSDELAKWRYVQETWDNLQLGLRLGSRPRNCVTTTPRPIKALKDIIADPGTVTTRGTSYENFIHLPPAFIERIKARYEGTRLGRQELHAEILEDTPGALWSRQRIDELRRRSAPELVRIVVAIDPAVSSSEAADETGVVVAGRGADGHGYVLEDLSLRGSPDGWARAAVSAYHRFEADRIIGEVNNGGEMVEHVVRTVDADVSYRAVRASRGKTARAEPIAALYEQGRVHHVGHAPELEDQMCIFTADYDRAAAGYSPDRVDALVWALSELMLGPAPGAPRVWGA